MWNPFKKKAPSGDQVFTFIWYKKMESNGATHYTAPFRTKITAPTRKQAVEKLTDFVVKKMTLVVVDEKDYHKDAFSGIEKGFKDLYNQMNSLFNKQK